MNQNPLTQFFANAIHESLSRIGISEIDAETYLADMLVRFQNQDELYGIRDQSGRRLSRISDMVAEGDVLMNATSFDREREVHRHIGDFLLFWSGLYPESLERRERMIDPVRQGAYSYYVVSTFDHGSYATEAPIFRKLSQGFAQFREGLLMVRSRFLEV